MWKIDPNLQQVNNRWDMWVWEKKSLARFQWDLGGLYRRVPRAVDGKCDSAILQLFSEDWERIPSRA
jgi:hypothetical protein